MDIAELGFRADTSTLQKAEGDLNDLTQATQRTEKATKNLAGGVAGLGRNANRSSRAFGGLATPLRQTSLQLSQVVQQTQATGNLFQSIAIQLPDIGLAFGTIGIAAGIAGGALLSFASNFLDLGNASDNLDDRLEALESTVKDLQQSTDILTLSAADLRDKYGEAADAVRQFAADQARLRLSQLNSQLQEQTSILEGTAQAYFTAQDAGRSYRNTLDRIGDDFGLTAEAAREFESALTTAATADTLDQQAAALRQVLDLLNDAGVAAEDIPAELSLALDEMISLVRETRAAEKAAQDVADAADNITASVGGAAAEAARLAFNLQNALDLSNDVAAGRIRGGVASGTLPPQALGDAPQTAAEAAITGRALEDIESGRRASARRSRRQGASQADRELQDMLRERDRILDGLKTAQDKYNDSVAQADRLLKAGVLTQSDYNRQIEQLGQELAEVEFGQLVDEIDSLSDSMADAIVQGDSLFDAIGQGARRAAAELISSGLSQAFQSIFNIPNTGRQRGGLFGNLFAGLFDGGGSIPRGQFGIVGERGPEIVTGPAMVTSRRETSRMMQGGGITLNLRTDPGVIVEIAENTAGAMIQQNNDARDSTFNQRSRTAEGDRKLR